MPEPDIAFQKQVDTLLAQVSNDSNLPQLPPGAFWAFKQACDCLILMQDLAFSLGKPPLCLKCGTPFSASTGG